MTLSAAERVDLAATAIAQGVSRGAATWVERQVAHIADLWGRLTPAEREALDRAAAEAGETATARVRSELDVLFATSVQDQAATPLEIVRTLGREATVALRAAGVPPIERDEFSVRAFPDDDYGLVPADLGALGDPELAPMLAVWGMAKAELLRSLPPSPPPS